MIMISISNNKIIFQLVILDLLLENVEIILKLWKDHDVLNLFDVFYM